MAITKMLIMLPLMFAARKLDGEDPNIIFMLRCSYFTVQFFIVLAVIYVYLAAQKLSKSKFKDMSIFVPPPPTPFPPPDPKAKKQYKQTTFGAQAQEMAGKLLQSTLVSVVLTSGMHFYKGMIVGLAMQSVMGPLNLFENHFAKAILLGGPLKADDTPKSRKLFGEKYREEITDEDEVIGAEGQVIVLKKEKEGSGKKKITTSTKSFEDILLDTWDKGEQANVTSLKNAINKKNANFKTSENSWTPLMIMVAIKAEGSDLVIKKLKEVGATSSITDEDGWNALHWAAFHGSESGAKFLLENFNCIKAGLHEVEDKEGKTPLQLAKEENNDDVLKVIEKAIASTGEPAGLSDKDGLRKRK
mmetsp:Transcript_9497/g.13964  ORF Transcript_9497/g.13964 Transcript_9497/m.13964 type:complete len:359 (+) Transcript_9497:155-1231(+)|eukprot:CAMPEP_0197234562 /NCGR_PEP_ID=MMETSP1429-20130617/2280_1 /TAXON_ID=49237 /ORGANISM="Chaetoceros  sp., Strain UNC1202" /LENGTH=358 /DNA_ID=CAMNT_0042693005 /DNA_START=155 /DNA_END=1231 /DNA_ORIENTATION=-